MKSGNRLRILNLGLVSSQQSQAIYHAVAACMSESSVDTIVLCQPQEPYFCIGYHQNVRQVLDSNVRSRLGYPVIRRRLGGGVTYLDNQQLFYQCIFDKRRSPTIPAKVYRERLRQAIDTLNRIGVKAELRYTNEIEVSGRRIAGIGGGLIGEASVVVGNVLNDFDFRIMSEIINSPCAAFRELAYKAMSDRITTLKRERSDHHWHDLPELLIEQYCQDFKQSVFLGELTKKERDEATRLAEMMGSESYLQEFQNDLLPQPVTRLKISGSTSIELVRVGGIGSLSRRYVVLKLRDGKIEEVADVEESAGELQNLNLLSTIRECDASQIQRGLSLA